jgi:arylsulfate sulfotransferase
MFLSNVLRRMRPRAGQSRGGSRHAHSRHFRARPLVLEALEDRCLLSTYSFALLADDSPNGIFSVAAGIPSVNDQGTAKFHATLSSTGADGVFTRNMNGELGIIAVTSSHFLGFPLSGGINDAGTVSFGAALSDGTQAIFTGRGGALSRIADTGPDSPFSSFVQPAANINNDEMVAFRATLRSGGTGIFLGHAGEAPRILYVTGGRFTVLLSQNLSTNGSDVVFRARLSMGGEGVFRGNGLTTTTIATTGQTYSAFSASTINDAGTVAFAANLTAGGQAVVTGDGTELTTVADTSGGFSSFFGNVSVNSDDQVVFAANLVGGGSGIFSAQDNEVDEIIGTGDSLFGSIVTSFAANPFAPRGLNNAGQLGFVANLADGRTVIVRADPLPTTISLEPSVASPDLVGEPVTWTATATHSGTPPVFQFSVGLHGEPLHVVHDFSPDGHFTWAPMQEGSYDVQVTVKNGVNATATHSAVASYMVDSRVTGAEAVISPTLNPLVALYSVPPATGEDMVYVQFSQAGDDPIWRNTHTLAVVPGESTNFFVAGMLPNTTYQMRHVFGDGTTSSPLLFTTGSIPSRVTFPTFTVRQAPDPDSDLAQDLNYHPLNPAPVVTDLLGHVVWYFDLQQSALGLDRLNTSALQPGGTVLGFGRDRYAVPNNRGLPPLNVLREIDLVGDPVRETNLAAVNPQLRALGHEPIYGWYHEVQHLPNGSTVALGITERTFNIDGTPTNYVGTMVVVLDEDFQVTWAWDAFDHLDINRLPVLGEIVDENDVPVRVAPILPAVDWLHNNAVTWSPADGNLILSLRTQDWVIKIDYRNGEGDGHVVWRLGQDGDFTVNSTDPNPWFSHQHQAHYIDDSTLILMDNGNTRHASDPNADSRGQVWRLDEQNMTATLAFNVDLGLYSQAEGGAQRLANGNYSFTLGDLGQAPNLFAQSIEVRPDGSNAYVLEKDGDEFRTYRIRTLYEGISDQLAAGGGRGRSAGSWLSGSVASSGSEPALFNSGLVYDLRGSALGPGTNLDDLGVAVAMASIAPLKQLAPVTMFPEMLPDLASGVRPVDGITLPLLDARKITSDGGGNMLTSGAARDAFFGYDDLDLTGWDAITATFVEL